VLLIDDSEDVRNLIRLQLEFDGRFEVIDEAENGKAGIALAIAHQPDAIVVDVMMPELDGVDAVTQIRDEVPNARIVMYSARGADQARKRALQAGADAYIEKGADAEALIAALMGS
jgi:two-component system chemotaxis response regulator CheY